MYNYSLNHIYLFHPYCITVILIPYSIYLFLHFLDSHLLCTIPPCIYFFRLLGLLDHCTVVLFCTVVFVALWKIRLDA